jgi:drug/metabolite transporter (DMT)-like permease
MSTRSTSAGILVALVSAATFATSGPFAKSLLDSGWTPGSVVLLRIAGAALLLLVPTVRALGGRWHLLRGGWRQVVAYGVAAVAVPQLAFFYAVQHLSVGVALLLEYLGLVLVVAWQCLMARRLPRTPTVMGIMLALVGLVLVLDLFGGIRVDGVGVAWGLLAAVGLASYFLLSGHVAEQSLPPLVLAGGGMVVAAFGFAVLGAIGALPMTFANEPAVLAGLSLPWWMVVLELAVFAAATPYITGIIAARILGAKLASFVGLSEVMFAVLFAWLLLGELPRMIQLLGGLFILAGVVAVRSEGPRDLHVEVVGPLGEDRTEIGSEVEAGLPVGELLLGDVAVVPDDRVQLGGVDVVLAQDHGGAVRAVQEHGPV